MQQITLRPVTDSDQPILFDIYASTRWEELKPTGWTDAEKTTFLAMQFDMQQRYYQQVYADADFCLVEANAAVAGRLYRIVWPEEIRIIDIALLPPYRNRGIGSCLIADIQRTATAQGLGVSIHAEHSNPARVLYDRLGFQAVEESGFYTRMHWSPA